MGESQVNDKNEEKPEEEKKEEKKWLFFDIYRYLIYTIYIQLLYKCGLI